MMWTYCIFQLTGQLQVIAGSFLKKNVGEKNK